MIIQRPTPPSLNAECIVSPSAPVETDRGFFKPQNPCPVDERALQAGLHVTLLIAPTSVDQRYSQRIDGHHGAAFPSHNPAFGAELQATTLESEIARDDARAIRWSRIQEVKRILHNRCHDAYDGTVVPANEHENFAVALLNAAKYIPAQAMDFSTNKPKLITLDAAMRQRLQAPGVIHKQRRMEARVGYFFGRYIIKHGLHTVLETAEVSQFLETTNELERLRLGRRILRLASRSVTDPVEGIYQSARAQGRISRSSPKRALGFMMWHFDHKQPDYFSTIERQLKAELAHPAA